MYLEHFNLSKLPFALTPNTEFFCDLPGYQAALDVLLVSLSSGEGFIKIVGEVGSGKTLLCRKLTQLLKEKGYATACIANPDLTPTSLRKALALELGVRLPLYVDQNSVPEFLQQHLLENHRQGIRTVIIIDEAQALSEPCLETIRLLTNLATDADKLLQVVLFGQPELDTRLNQTSLRQLKQRIAFSYFLQPLKRNELVDYLAYRLNMAGYNYGSLFNNGATQLLFKASQGIPRVINILCHKAMLVAYSRGEKKISYQAMRLAVHDSKGIVASKQSFWQYGVAMLGLVAIGVLAAKYHHELLTLIHTMRARL